MVQHIEASSRDDASRTVDRKYSLILVSKGNYWYLGDEQIRAIPPHGDDHSPVSFKAQELGQLNCFLLSQTRVIHFDLLHATLSGVV